MEFSFRLASNPLVAIPKIISPMALSMSTYLSRGRYGVAIAGATGKLGSHIAMTFLGPQYRSFFSQVVLFTRDPESQKAKDLQRAGGELIQIELNDPNAPSMLSEVFLTKGIDVVVNALGTFDHDARENLLNAITLVPSSIHLYILAEFGVDHRYNSFSHSLWDDKRCHAARARKEGKKVVAIYAGVILELGILMTAQDGLSIKEKKVSALGSPDTQISFTSLADIAKATAQTVIQAISSITSFPDDIRIAGTTASWTRLREIMTTISGEDVTIETNSDLQTYRKALEEKQHGTGDAFGYIKLLMGEGKLDFSADNQNELVNPEQKYWKWTTLEEYAERVKKSI